jgi:uncharacterized protein with LGFP repeats
MKTTTLAPLAAVAVLFTAVHAKADSAPPAPVEANPDAATQKVAAPHVFVQLGGGASVTSVDGGDVHYISTHAHFDLAIGRELLAIPLGSDRLSLGLGYAGSVDASSDEILHRHGIALMVRKSWFSATLSGGVSMLQGFDPGVLFVGGHFGFVPAFRLGPVQLAFPIYVDGFSVAATTFGATLGFQI